MLITHVFLNTFPQILIFERVYIFFILFLKEKTKKKMCGQEKNTLNPTGVIFRKAN